MGKAAAGDPGHLGPGLAWGPPMVTRAPHPARPPALGAPTIAAPMGSGQGAWEHRLLWVLSDVQLGAQAPLSTSVKDIPPGGQENELTVQAGGGMLPAGCCPVPRDGPLLVPPLRPPVCRVLRTPSASAALTKWMDLGHRRGSGKSVFLPKGRSVSRLQVTLPGHRGRLFFGLQKDRPAVCSLSGLSLASSRQPSSP